MYAVGYLVHFSSEIIYFFYPLIIIHAGCLRHCGFGVHCIHGPEDRAWDIYNPDQPANLVCPNPMAAICRVSLDHHFPFAVWNTASACMAGELG